MKPSWDDAPEWAKWIAQDLNGEWWFYERQPNECLVRWSSSARCDRYNAAVKVDGWRETLERRP